MMKQIVGTILLVAALSSAAHAAGDLTSQEPVELRVELGDAGGALQFFPASLELETGKLYRVVFYNPSPQKHYFSSDQFSRAVYTRKVQVNDAAGKATAEIKGMIREIEVYPNGTTEWWLVPVKAGVFNDLLCTIEGHAEGGMVGVITVK